MKEYRTLNVYGKRGVELLPNTRVFHNKADADEHARETRSYVAKGIECEKGEEDKIVWYVPA